MNIHGSKKVENQKTILIETIIIGGMPKREIPLTDGAYLTKKATPGDMTKLPIAIIYTYLAKNNQI
jgi:hypothetical protein